MATSGRVLKFRTPQVARQVGELARLRVLKGADRGTIFVIKDSRVTVGRGEDSDVMIADLKASRLHAEISSSPVGWQVRDLGSANGVLHNGKQLRSAVLKSADLLTVGETVLEFLGAESATQMLQAPVPATRQIELQQLARQEKSLRARSLMDPFGAVSGAELATPTRPQQTLRIAVLAAVAVGAALLMLEGQSPSAKKKKTTDRKIASTEKQDLASLLPKLEEPARNKTAEMFFKQGFREFTAGNYLRAKAQFDLVLQIVPDHEMARRYRDNSTKAMDDEVKLLLETGRKALEIGRVREARGSFEAVKRMLSTDRTHPAYLEAVEQLKAAGQESSAERNENSDGQGGSG